MYERGLEATQRHEYVQAAAAFRSLLDRYPDERELHDRARLYLKICERQSSPPPSVPQSREERVYAATLALNTGGHARAREYLLGVLAEDPDNDHAHYMLAVAFTLAGDRHQSLVHLRRAIELNPENRSLARQDEDLDALKGEEGFRLLVEIPSYSRRRRGRPGR